MGMIIPKQTAAKTTGNIDLTGGKFPKTLHVAGLLVTETIPVNVVDEGGSALPFYQDGSAFEFAVDSSPLAIYSPIRLQFVKPSTTNAVGIQLVERI